MEGGDGCGVGVLWSEWREAGKRWRDRETERRREGKEADVDQFGAGRTSDGEMGCGVGVLPVLSAERGGEREHIIFYYFIIKIIIF